MKKGILVLGGFALLFAAVFAVVKIRSDKGEEELRRQDVSLGELSKTLEEMERALPQLVQAGGKALGSVRAMKDRIAKAQAVAPSDEFKNLQVGHRHAEVVLESSIQFMGSSGAALMSERRAVDLLRENHTLLSSVRLDSGGRARVQDSLARVDELLKGAEATARFVGPLVGKQQGQLADMHSQVRNWLALSKSDSDLGRQLTELVMLLELGGESTHQALKVHAFCENLARKLRHEEGVQKGLCAIRE